MGEMHVEASSSYVDGCTRRSAEADGPRRHERVPPSADEEVVFEPWYPLPKRLSSSWATWNRKDFALLCSCWFPSLEDLCCKLELERYDGRQPCFPLSRFTLTLYRSSGRHRCGWSCG